MACPNKSHPDYKKLVTELGEGRALAAFTINNEEIPSLEEARKLLSRNTPTAPLSLVQPLFQSSVGLTPTNQFVNDTITAGAPITDFSRGEDFNKKYPTASKVIDDIGAFIQIVEASELERNGRKIKATYDPWDNIIKATKDASPQTLIHEVLHGVMFKSSNSKTEDEFKKTPLGKALLKFATSLKTISLPDNETINSILENIGQDSIQESATYGVVNYTFTKALNDVIVPAQKVPEGLFTDIARDTLNKLPVKPNTKLAELLNILTTHTNTAAPEVAKPIDPIVTEAVDRKFNKLKQIDKTVKKVVEDAGTHLSTTFEVDGEKVKFKVEDQSVGIKGVIGKRLAITVEDNIDEIMNRFIGNDGFIKETPDPKDSNSTFNEKVYQMLEDVISARLKKYPVGTKFSHNINIYSEAWNKAANVDFLALTPDGKADLLSFDIIGKANYGSVEKGSPLRDVKDKDQAAMREYLNQIKGILKTTYDIKEFNQSRSIPLYITITPVKVGAKVVSNKIADASWDGLNSSTSNRKAIDVIPTWDESTGNKAMDSLIRELIALNEVKGGERYSEVNIKAKKAIAKSIRAIQIDKGIPSLVQMINAATKSSTFTVADFEKNVRYMDVNDITPIELASISTKLNKSSNELKMYGDLYLYYKDYYPAPSESEQKALDKLENASKDARFANAKLTEVKREFIQDKVAKKHGIENFLLPEGKVGWYEANINTFDKPVTKAQYVFYRMLNNARNVYQNRTRDSLVELSTIYEGVQEWKKDKSNSDFLDLIKKKDEKGNRINELIGQYQKAFYTTVKEKIEEIKSEKPEVRKAAVEWLKNNTDQEALKEWAIKERSRKLQWISENISEGDYYYDEAIDAANKNFDISKPFIYQNYNAIKQFPRKDLWQTNEFNKLEKAENAPVMALYKYIRSINSIASRVGYLESEKVSRFLPFLRKTLVERTVLGGSYSFTDSILESLTVTKFETEYGGSFDRIANEAIDILPKYFTKDIGQEKIDNDGNRYTDYSNISDDVIKNVALYMGKVFEYEEKIKLEDQIKLLLEVEKNKGSLQTNTFGRIMPDVQPLSSNDKNYEILKDFVQNQFYGQSYVQDKYTDVALKFSVTDKWNKIATKANKFVGFELMSKKQDDRRISAIKVLHAMQHVQQVKVLGINLAASTYSFLSTNVQGWINAGEYYTAKELFKHDLRHAALQAYKGNAELSIALLKQFLPVDSQLSREIGKMSLSKLTTRSFSDLMMQMIGSANDYIQFVNFGAMMDNAVIIDGKLHNARKYIKASEKHRKVYDKSIPLSERNKIKEEFEADVVKLVEEYGAVNKASVKDGKLIIEGIDLNDESVAQFKALVKSVGRRLSGNISSDNESRIRMTVMGRQLLMFKNWILGTINTRLTGLSHNEGLQDYEWGRMRMMGKVLVTEGIFRVDKLISIIKATDKGIDIMDKMYHDKKEAYERDTQREFKMTKEAFYDLVRRNINQQLKELAAMLVLLGIFMAIAAEASDADDDGKGVWAFNARVLHRAYEDINLYYNPISMENLVNGSMFPTFGFLTDLFRFLGAASTELYALGTGDSKLEEKTHVAKYAMKNFPFFSQVPNYIAMLSPELAKQLGITVNAKQVNH